MFESVENYLWVFTCDDGQVNSQAMKTGVQLTN